jgi:hypothetical protein
MVQNDGKLPQSVVSAFHYRCPSRASFGEINDQQGVASVQQPTKIGAVQREGEVASYIRSR